MIDPWILTQRAVVSSSLLNATHVPAVFGEDNLGNILWGLDIQTRWQISSGRHQSKSSLRIDEFAWFANINYLLTVVPYIAAMKSNLLPPTEFLPPQSNSVGKFPLVYEDIDQDIARDWTNYFETIKILQIDPTYISSDNLQRLLWVVHNRTVAKAIPEFDAELQLLNFQEKKFSNGFGHFVEVLAMMNIKTDYPSIYSLNQMFPQRVLRVSDAPPLILEMSFQQNAIISAYFTINDMLELPWTLFVNSLRDAMNNVNCAVRLQQTLTNFLKSPTGDIIASLTSIISLC